MQHPAIPTTSVQVQAVMRSDVGMVRERNEDAAYVDPDGLYFLVADGMGGHAAGDVASGMAIDTVRQHLDAARPRLAGLGAEPREARSVAVKAVVEAALRAAHRAVSQRARRELDKRGMGTTLEVVVVAGDELFVAHVGDGRTYLVRDGAATLLTRDHTMAQVMVGAGTITMDEARQCPARSVLLNAIGLGADITIDFVCHELRSGDRVLLCSDGLYEHFGLGELAERLSRGPAAASLLDLVAVSRERGGQDNITGIIADVMFVQHPSAVRPLRPVPPPIPPPRRAPRRPTSPLADVSEHVLFSIVERVLHEETGPLLAADR